MPVDGKALDLYVEIRDQNASTPDQRINLELQGDVYTGTAQILSGNTYQYEVKSNNYNISNGTNVSGSLDISNQESPSKTISAQGWTFTPNFARNTILTVGAQPQVAGQTTWGNPVVLTATLKDGSGNALQGKNVYFKITDEKGQDESDQNSYTTNEKGVATYIWTPASGMKYTIVASWNGDADTALGTAYAGTTSQPKEYTPSKKDASLVLSTSAPQAWNNGVVLTAQLKEGENDITDLSEGTVQFYVVAENGSQTPIENGNINVENGKASFTYTGLTGGKKVTFAASYTGGSKYVVSTSVTTDYDPLPVAPTLTLTPDPVAGNGSWQSEVKLTAKLTGGDGQTVSLDASEITFFVDGDPLKGQVAENADGTVFIQWTPGDKKDFKLGVKFNGNDDYSETSLTAPISYTPGKASAKFEEDSLKAEVQKDSETSNSSWQDPVKLSVKLTDQNNQVIKDADTQVKFTITWDDGSKEITSTGLEGDVYVATWQPENAKKVTITASYGGGDRFNGATSISINYQPNLAQQSFTVKTNDDEQTPIEKLEFTYTYGSAATTYILSADTLSEDEQQKRYPEFSSDFSIIVDSHDHGKEYADDIVEAKIENGQLILTPKNVGTTEIVIQQNEYENFYAASTKPVTITVEPYELSIKESEDAVQTRGNKASDESESLEWDNTKTYDATNNVDVRVEVDLSDLEGLESEYQDALIASFDSTVAPYEGNYSTMKETDSEGQVHYYIVYTGAKAVNTADIIHVSDSEESFSVNIKLNKTSDNNNLFQNYVFKDGKEEDKSSIDVEAAITIEQRPLTLVLNDSFTRQYNKLNELAYFAIAADASYSTPIIDVTGFPGDRDSEAKKQIIDKVSSLSLEALFAEHGESGPYISINGNDLTVNSPLGQTYQGALSITDTGLELFNDNELENSDYIFSGSTGGSVTIVEEQIQSFTSYMKLNTGSYNAFQETPDAGNTQSDPKIYYGQDAKAYFEVSSPYNRVYMVNSDKDNSGGTLINVDQPQTSFNVNVAQETFYYYLESVDDETGTVVGKTSTFGITFYRDVTVPTTSIAVGEDNIAVYEFGKLITFGLYQNTPYVANVTVTDPAGTENASDNVSGIASVSYRVVNLAQDVDPQLDYVAGETDTDDALYEKVFDVVIKDAFKSVTLDKDGKFTVPVRITDEDEIGNYVVFVRVEDNVGNAAIYGSNGMIFENVPATDVTINFDETSNNNKVNYKGADHFANGESVTLSITANENSDLDVWSGIHKIDYTVTSESRDGISYTAVPESGVFEQTPPDGVTLAELKENYSSLTGIISNIYTTQDQSQIVTVTASATDFAGNESAQVSRTFVIDPVAPVISDTLTSGAQVQNGKYYNQDVVITTEITERFLDMENKLIYTINGSTMTLGELLSRKADFGISSIAVDYGTDGPVGEERSDNSKSTVTITFHDDGEYTISAQVSDYAGNQSAPTQTDTFVVDQTKPVATVTYYSYGTGQTFAPGAAANAPYYLNQNYSSFKAVVSVTELNFEKDGNVNTNLTIGATNSENRTTDEMTSFINTHGANVKSAQNWSDPSGITRTYTVDVTADANYSFDFNYTDLAGNELEVAVPTAYVTLDRVVPSGEITVNGFVNGVDGNNNATQKSWFEQFISAITFGLFGKDSVTASMTSSDVTSGMASTQYIATSALLSKAQLAARTDWRDYTGNINLVANENVIVYEKVTDKAGNTEYYSTENMVVDNTDPAPVVTVTPSSPAWGKGVYAATDNPGFDISVTDPSVNNAYSGLKEITYQIVNGTTGYTESGILATFNRTEHTQSWSGHVSIDPNAFYSNDVQITVSATDWSTNDATSETQSIKVDNKAPVVTFSLSTADALNGKYYKNNKTLTITVDERNFDPSYTPTVTSTSGGGYSFGGWSSNGEIHTGVITFSGDSDYTVTFDCYDLAGNHSNTERQEEFTVDKTLPTVSVSYNNNDVLNGHYYSAARTATVTITEHNFRASEVRVTTTASLNGSSISAPSISGWSTSGDRHTATISFSGDGDYTFDIAYTDLAGNAMADYAQDSFTVDLTDPEIEITGVENRSANKGTVAPVITLSDTNYTADGVTLTLTGTNKGRINVDSMVSRTSNGNGQIITFRNFGSNMDDIYTLTARLVDRAGNETTRSITFSVNRDGSTYELDDYVAQLIETGFTNSPKDIVIKEINVDTLEFIEITYSKDGEVVTLKEGVDYTVEEEGGDGQWKVYTYTIKASCFEEEGQYSINIYSEDRAQNTSTYQVKNSKLEKEEQMTLEFIVDKTAPSISIANLEDRGRYRESAHEFTLSVKDNMLLSYVELYLDGVLYHTYSGDELTIDDGLLTITVDSKDAYQTVKIIAYDAAGNPTDPVEYQVLVTSNWWIQFYMNKPLFFGCIAGIVVVAGVIIFLVVRSRRKADKKTYKKI